MTNNAVAKKDEPTAGAMVKQYAADFAAVLPSHIPPATWVRLAQGALKKGKRINPNDPDSPFELEVAALNNVGVFLATLLDAARLGLEPGTEQFHLTPRKVKGRLEILGIPGYQGIVELIYRAGAVSSVIVEVVRQRDGFIYRPGRDERPLHEIDWDLEDRGPLKLAYAYAVMKDGATSKVVVLNKAQIAAIKKSSQGATSEYSPWVTNPEAMWLKSAARQLAKWVPTSAEYRKEQLRAAQEVAAERDQAVRIQPIRPAEGQYIDPLTGEVYESIAADTDQPRRVTAAEIRREPEPDVDPVTGEVDVGETYAPAPEPNTPADQDWPEVARPPKP
jgi:recombination protein RecT